MYEKHENEAGKPSAVFPIQILLNSNRCNFSGFDVTAMKFSLITHFSMLFPTMSMLVFISPEKNFSRTQLYFGLYA